MRRWWTRPWRLAGLRVSRFTGDLTDASVERSRLGTQAESYFLREAGCHRICMTHVPEAFLAREVQMAYATEGLGTDCQARNPRSARE